MLKTRWDGLKAVCPNGIDVYVDHTAGPILEAVLQQINLGAKNSFGGFDLPIQHRNST